MPASKIAPASATGRRHAPAEARRAQILAAALRCFADKGYHAARMDDLARASRLSKGSLYWHFRGKEDVFLALFDALEAEVFAAWEHEAAHAPGALALLRREGEIVIERMAGQRILVIWRFVCQVRYRLPGLQKGRAHSLAVRRMLSPWGSAYCQRRIRPTG